MADRREEALTGLLDLVSINTHSHNTQGLDTSADRIADLFAPLGEIAVEPTPPAEFVDDEGRLGTRPLGPMVRVTRHGTGPRILLISHHDTVFAPDVSFGVTRDGDVLRGPGVADAKGGIMQLWLALGALQAAGVDQRWELLVVGDEEIGSPGSNTAIREASGHADLGLGFEPSFPDGTLAAARPGSGNFTVVVSGRAAHAGREHAKGRNAVVAAATLATRLAEYTDRPDVLVNPGVISGGTAFNIVPDHAQLRFNVRVTSTAHMETFQDRLRELVDAIAVDGISVSVHGGFGRPPKVRTPRYNELMRRIAERGAALDMDVRFADTGGVCDGNLMADEGLVNVDNLGPIGGNLHQVGEYLEVDSLIPRALLTADLIANATTLIAEETPS